MRLSPPYVHADTHTHGHADEHGDEHANGDQYAGAADATHLRYPGVPCTTVVGSTCTAGSGVNGSWTKTGSGTFTFTATGPGNSVVGGNPPTLFIPTTANPAGERFTCTAVGAQFTTTCTGTTAGDLLLGATVTIDFPLVGGGFAPVTGTIFGPAG